MATVDENLSSLIASVVTNCDEILTSSTQTSLLRNILYGGGSALHGYNSSNPFEYLREWCWTRSWDEYFSHIMDRWDNDLMNAMLSLRG